MTIINFKLILIFATFMTITIGFYEILSQATEDAVRSYGKQLVEKPAYLTAYDFIIVGSGPAGCVLANRLSENENWKILLIEAGTVETIFQSIPLNAPYLVDSRYNWGYVAEKQNYSCRGMANGRCLYPRGRALGGTSVINGMLYTRGAKGDFDHWKLLGIDGWDYETEVLPAFKKSERASLKYPHKPNFHGRDGLLNIANNPYSTPMAEIFMDGLKQLGYDEIDYNSDESIGYGRLQSTTKFTRRHSAFDAFIIPALGRNNLDIMLNTRATKTLINPVTKTAFGVEVFRDGRRMNIYANREVILSAGSFHSPQLLILSGIGSTEDLKKLEIPQIVDLPVGKEMYDHFAFGGIMIQTNITNPFADPFEWNNLLNLTLDFVDGTGLFTIPNGAEVLGFFKLGNQSTPVESQPDIEIIMVGANPASDGGFGLKYGEGISNYLYDTWLKPIEKFPNHIIALGIVLLHPKSVGFMKVTSKSIFDAPKFYSNCLMEPEDVESYLLGVKLVHKLVLTEPFQKVAAKIYDRPITMCKSYIFDSDDYWRCAIRTFMPSVHHQVGTCKMGNRNDKTAVVDSKLKVFGVENLRVVDTSVIPSATSAHTAALAFMIGERGAEFIKMEHEENENLV